MQQKILTTHPVVNHAASIENCQRLHKAKPSAQGTEKSPQTGFPEDSRNKGFQLLGWPGKLRFFSLVQRYLKEDMIEVYGIIGFREGMDL